MASFFIRRPIVAIVISILICVSGGVSLSKLAIEQYPPLAPPTVRVSATYGGANAEVVEQSVATPIEQEINGVDNLLYLKSLNTSDGRMQLDVTFDVGTDLNNANMLAQNRVSQAQARLPSDVLQRGVTVKKTNPSILLVASIYSPKRTYDALFLSNYAVLNVKDALLRVPGVSQVDSFGAGDYSIRVWLRPDDLSKLGLTPGDVVNAVREQNLQAPAGQIGAAPSLPGQQFTYTVRAPGKLSTPEEFGDIIVRATADGRQVRVKDVARVELGSELYKSFARLNGQDAAVMSVYLLPGANQLATAQGIYRALEDLKRFFPRDMDYRIVYDTTPAVEASIEEITHTLFEAVVLVVIVVFLFLQNWRATFIPLLTVPVSLLGTFMFFPLLGFSVNTLTMFGLVLAIGIVVDDAIVVVEAVMHHIEHGMDPKAATRKAMDEVSGPVVGIGLVLTGVFVPVAFMGGLTGRLYQQFALTIAIAVILSVFNALTLSPALAAMLLKPARPARGPLGWFFRKFNGAFEISTRGYTSVAGMLARRSVLSLVILGGVVAGTWWFAGRVPGGFVPNEDQGIFLVNVQLPNGASLERTDRVLKQVEAVLDRTPGVESHNSIGGMGMLTSSYQSNFGSFFVRLKPWDERTKPEEQLRAILAHAGGQMAKIPEAIAFPFVPPSLPGFGAAGGFNLLLQDRSGTLTVPQLGDQANRFMAAARKRPELQSLFTAFDPTVPQYQVELDREKARKLGIPIPDVFNALNTVLGGAFVNDFNRFGRLYRVFVQAEASYRQAPEDIGKIYVRSTTTGGMVPLNTLVTVSAASGTELTTRYNLFRSVEVSGSAASGYSSAQAMAALEQVAAEVLPPEMGYEYTGLSYQEKNAPPVAPTFAMAVLFVFLLLAALYESWSLPWAVLLGTPVVVLGAFFGVWLLGFDNNVYVQVGLIMLVGLAAKNAILIVEFAKAEHEKGKELLEAASEAARLRFRPILMTAFAFIMGVIPLMLATGSGAASRTVMGAAVFFGMLVATAIGVFIYPALFVLVTRITTRSPRARKAAEPVVTMLVLVAAATLSGCAVGPTYKRPEVPVPPQYRGVQVTPEQAGSLGDLPWVGMFGDPDLAALVREALQNNLEMQAAAARVEEFRGRAALAGADLRPTVGASFSTAPSPTGGAIDNAYTAGLFFNWEIDFFGRLRRSAEAARADLLATEMGQRAVMTSVVTGVADLYLTLRALDDQVAILSRNVQIQEDSLALVRKLAAGGLASGQEEQQALQLLASTRAGVPRVERQRIQAENALSVLLGRPPSPVTRGTAPVTMPEVPPGLPSTLLERRADVLGAEQQLRAATARIGVAVASRFPFPRIGLTSAFGRVSTALDDFITGGDKGETIFSLGFLADLPLIDGGRGKARVSIAKAQAEEAVIAYRAAVLQSLREVADALATGETIGRELAETQTSLAAAREYLRLTNLRYRGGVTSYLEVLDAQRQVLSAELAVNSARTTQLSASIALYRALGGGWSDEELKALAARSQQAGDRPPDVDPTNRAAPEPGAVTMK